MAPEEIEQQPKVYLILGEINGKLDGIIEMQSKISLDAIIEMQYKIIYILIGLAAATVGLRLVESPPLAVISRFINLFVFTFALATAIGRRKIIYGWQYVLLYGVFGMLGNVYYLVFRDHEWLRTTIFILANSSMALFVWNWDKWKR